MIPLTNKLIPTGFDLHPTEAIPSGSVYVAGSDFAAELPPDKHVVLQTSNADKLELTTRNQIATQLSSTGTYLNMVDYNSLNYRAAPQLRLYTWHDTFAKIRSAPGILLLVPALLALLTAVAGVFFLLSSQGQPSPASITDEAQSVLTWAAAQPSAARTALATQCLQLIGGHQLPAVSVPGVTCAPPTAQWWQSATIGSIVTGCIAVLTAIVGFFGLPAHYGFRKSPAGGS
jgi:hypothetical protein